MDNILEYAIIAVAGILLLESAWLLLYKKGANRKACKKRNLLYPFQLFAMVFQHPELRGYLGELSDECVGKLFCQGYSSLEKLKDLPAQEIEKICIEHNRKIPNTLDSKVLRLPNPRIWIKDWCPYALLHLLKTYVQGKLGTYGQNFLQEFLARYQQVGYALLVTQSDRSEAQFARIYPDTFFQNAQTLEELESYPDAINYLLQAHENQQLGPYGKKFIQRILAQSNARLYEMLVARSPDNLEYLAKIYTDEFFSRIQTLAQLHRFPKALNVLIALYIQNHAGPHAKSLFEKLVTTNAELYPEISRAMYRGNEKEFALEMIQSYLHIPVAIKIEILRCKQGNRYVDASIEKLQKQGEIL